MPEIMLKAAALTTRLGGMLPTSGAGGSPRRVMHALRILRRR
jgi:hypothetical protein